MWWNRPKILNCFQDVGLVVSSETNVQGLGDKFIDFCQKLSEADRSLVPRMLADGKVWVSCVTAAEASQIFGPKATEGVCVKLDFRRSAGRLTEALSQFGFAMGVPLRFSDLDGLSNSDHKAQFRIVDRPSEWTRTGFLADLKSWLIPMFRNNDSSSASQSSQIEMKRSPLQWPCAESSMKAGPGR